MATKNRAHELRGIPTCEIRDALQLARDTMAQASRNGYADTHPAIQSIQRQMEHLTAELMRRADGGAVLPDVRVPMMTDGERLALGLEPRDDE